MFRGMFGRENTALKDGKYVKDLSYLNRPLKEVIYIDFTDEHMDYQQDNVLIVPKFEGDTEDRELVDLMPFLEHLARYPGDVRKEIKRLGREDGYKKYAD
jgi:import inner membrane translocase subunit TIM50